MQRKLQSLRWYIVVRRKVVEREQATASDDATGWRKTAKNLLKSP